jgi:hypothetical protein
MKNDAVLVIVDKLVEVANLIGEKEIGSQRKLRSIAAAQITALFPTIPPVERVRVSWDTLTEDEQKFVKDGVWFDAVDSMRNRTGMPQYRCEKIVQTWHKQFGR